MTPNLSAMFNCAAYYVDRTIKIAKAEDVAKAATISAATTELCWQELRRRGIYAIGDRRR
jgi:hypothetical protein